MNIPPTSAIRVPAASLRDFAARLGRAGGLADEQAELLARLLTDNDRRGVVSHGTQQLATYVRLLRAGTLNPSSAPSVVRETGQSVLVDGDGGLGYFPAHEMTARVLAKIDAGADLAVGMTRNHGHFGAAGLYARMTLDHDVVCFVTSGHQLQLAPGGSVFDAAGGSPMAFTAPAAEEESLVLDFGAMHDLYSDDDLRSALVERVPGLVHRSIGLGAICQTWGGFWAGVPLDEQRAERRFAGANQGSLVLVVRIDLFASAADFRAEVDRYVRTVAELRPISGDGPALLPGGIEARRAAEYDRDGVPVGEQHQLRLEEVADEVGVPVPWERLG